MSSRTQPLRIGIQIQSRSLWIYVVTVVVVVCVGYLLLHRLAVFPAPWRDEGSYIQIAKNFAFKGIYAEISSEGPRFSSGVIATGPTVILPLAVLFKLFGFNMVLARLMIVLTGVISLILLVVLGKRVGNLRIALAAALLVFVSPRLEFVATARNVLGEVPGIMFVLAALWVWMRSKKPSNLELVAVGILFGLASITKNQYAIFLLPGLLVSWLADLFYYRQRCWRYFVIPGIVAGIIFFSWTFYVFVLLGDGTDTLSTLRNTAANAFFVLDLDTFQSALGALTSPMFYGGLILPTLVYGFLMSSRRTEEGQRWGILFIFIVIGVVEYLFSLGWSRYLFAPLMLLSLFLASLLSDLSDGFSLNWAALRGVLGGERPTLPTVTSMMVVGYLFVLIAWPIFSLAKNVTLLGSADAYSVAGFLNENAPPDALIETWELELGALTDHQYHFATQEAMTMMVVHDNFGGPYPGEQYDFREYGNPDFVVIGAYGRRGHGYTEERLASYQRIQVIGDYEIYQRK